MMTGDFLTDTDSRGGYGGTCCQRCFGDANKGATSTAMQGAAVKTHLN